MKDDRKADIRRHYGELLDVQERLRTVSQASGLDVALASTPGDPNSVDQLAEVMNVVRSNMNLVQSALNDLDRQTNGCEIRTHEAIEDDISHDLRLLSRPESADGDRSRDDIERNIAYDEMQLGRS
jgi:hypothetical protein